LAAEAAEDPEERETLLVLAFLGDLWCLSGKGSLLYQGIIALLRVPA
jgi:hypothetical protein